MPSAEILTPDAVLSWPQMKQEVRTLYSAPLTLSRKPVSCRLSCSLAVLASFLFLPCQFLDLAPSLCFVLSFFLSQFFFSSHHKNHSPPLVRFQGSTRLRKAAGRNESGYRERTISPVGYSKGKASWTAVTEGTPGQLILLSMHTPTLQAKCGGHLETRTPATGQAGPAELCCSGLFTSLAAAKLSPETGGWYSQCFFPAPNCFVETQPTADASFKTQPLCLPQPPQMTLGHLWGVVKKRKAQVFYAEV